MSPRAPYCLGPGSITLREGHHSHAPLPFANVSCPEVLMRFSYLFASAHATRDQQRDQMLAQRKFTCCDSDAERARFLATHDFSTCDGRTLTLVDALPSLVGKTIAFVGDSTVQELFSLYLVPAIAAAIRDELCCAASLHITDRSTSPSAHFDQAAYMKNAACTVRRLHSLGVHTLTACVHAQRTCAHLPKGHF